MGRRNISTSMDQSNTPVPTLLTEVTTTHLATTRDTSVLIARSLLTEVTTTHLATARLINHDNTRTDLPVGAGGMG